MNTSPQIHRDLKPSKSHSPNVQRRVYKATLPFKHKLTREELGALRRRFTALLGRKPNVRVPNVRKNTIVIVKQLTLAEAHILKDAGIKL